MSPADWDTGSMADVPQDMRVLVEQALSEGRRQVENSGNMEGLFLVRMRDGRIQKASIMGKMTELLNIGPAKVAIFELVRKYVVANGATAVAFASDTWMGIPTEKQMRMAHENPGELERIAKGLDFDGFVEKGLVTRAEAIVITVQTPETYAIVSQLYERRERSIVWGERTVSSGPQTKFTGRGKMYG